jgi:hypothetical protein
VQEKNLIGLMQKAMKETIRHGGYLIRLKSSETKNKLVVSEATPDPSGDTKH